MSPAEALRRIAEKDPRYAALAASYPDIPEPAVKPLCVYLGPLVKRSDCSTCIGQHTFKCGLGMTDCRPGVECQTCERHEADTPGEP